MARHGSRGRYNRGCRCGACSEANAGAARARRDRLRQESEAGSSFLVGGQVVRPPARPAALSPLQERSAEASAKAAAVRGTGEAAQRRRDRLEAEALAADLLDRQDRLRPARAPAAGTAPAMAPYGIVTPGWAATWRAASELLRNPASPARAASLAERRVQAPAGQARRPAPGPTPTSHAAPADVDGLEAYTEDLRRWISGQGPPPGRLERVTPG